MLKRPDWKFPLTENDTPLDSQLGISDFGKAKGINKRYPSVSDTRTAKMEVQKKRDRSKPPLLATNIDVKKMREKALEESRQTIGGFVSSKPAQKEKVQFVKKFIRQNSMTKPGSQMSIYRSDMLKEIYIDSSIM